MNERMSMTLSKRGRFPFALAIAATAFGGCAVGTAYVSAPERLPSDTLPPLTRPIRFDICGQPDPLTGRPYLADAGRAALGHRVRTLLSQAGVPAELTAARGSPVDLTITLSNHDEGPTWSAVLSVLTVAVVPGYLVERKILDVDLAWRDRADGEKTEQLRYEARTHLFFWLPLILSPDFLWPGGWESAKSRNGGFKQMVERLADDIRVRRGGAEAPIPVIGGLACPIVEPGSLGEASGKRIGR
jgi:hypothetical protein